jgi:hypothetical protein
MSSPVALTADSGGGEDGRMGAKKIAAVGAVACTAAALSAVAAAVPSGSRDEVIGFSTPSKNIGCDYAHFTTPPMSLAELRCDIRSGLRPKPARPVRCDLDWGDSYAMRKTGRPYVVCHGDTALGSKKIIGYGRTWRHDGFTCVSRASGLRCTNLSGHGFFLSRARSYRF